MINDQPFIQLNIYKYELTCCLFKSLSNWFWLILICIFNSEHGNLLTKWLGNILLYLHLNRNIFLLAAAACFLGSWLHFLNLLNVWRPNLFLKLPKKWHLKLIIYNNWYTTKFVYKKLYINVVYYRNIWSFTLLSTNRKKKNFYSTILALQATI